MALVGTTLTSGIIISFINYIHKYPIDDNSIDDDSISENAKIERLKLMHNLWSTLLTTAIVVTAAFGYTNYSDFPKTAEMLAQGKEERFLIIQASIAALVVIGFFALILLVEIIKKIIHIENLLLKIKHKSH